MSSPQVKTRSSNQTNTNSTQTTQQITWETLLKTPRIEKQHVDFAINNLETAPQLPVEFVYSQVATDVKISPPTSVAISGVGGVIGAILVLRYTTDIKVLYNDEGST